MSSSQPQPRPISSTQAQAKRTVPHSDLLVAFLKVALTASDRALLATDCPDVRSLVECAQFNLAAAHDLIQTDRSWAA